MATAGKWEVDGGDDENGEEKARENEWPAAERTEIGGNVSLPTLASRLVSVHPGTHPLLVAATLDCPNPRYDGQHEHGQYHRGPVLSRHASEAGDGRSERGRSVGRLGGFTVGCRCRSVDLKTDGSLVSFRQSRATPHTLTF
jgi:hypothetical protein